VVRRILFLGLIESLGVCVVFFWRIHSAGIPLSEFHTSTTAYREAITMAHASIVVSQFFVGFTVRSDRHSVFKVGLLSNPYLLGAAIFGVSAMAAISYLSPLQSVFNTAPLSVTDWLLLIAFGAFLLVADETRKWFLRRRTGRTDDVGTTSGVTS
jgi:P-type Ca2+ transporter type 2C